MSRSCVAMKRHAVAVAIMHQGQGGTPRIPDLELLTVRRPPDDEDLPDVWGLPAASLREGESWEDAGRRAGREKLGVELLVGPLLAEGETERAGYTLHMRLYGATIQAGEPAVPQPVAGVTQYADWRWSAADTLEQAAARGSLCSRLALRWVARERDRG